ncbi:NlpC/P60 family protein [Streptomyces sp. NPDC005246]|uniref:NlpC/P60 family protein n=1 Tax=Streptomyces sp. NPDC005246 TaxID=3156716 RepID=UPI0033BA1FD1
MRVFASSKWGQLTTEIPVALLKSLKNSIFGGDGSGTAATGGVGRALMWARSKAGMPYQWGGAGNPSFDCSGFMSSIQKVILGQVPKGRLWSTFSFSGDNAPAGWVRNLRSPFQIGITNNGVGHTAGTLAGVKSSPGVAPAWSSGRARADGMTGFSSRTRDSPPPSGIPSSTTTAATSRPA